MRYPLHLSSFCNGTVLVVSSSESRLLFMKVLLTRHHYRVITAANEEEACDQTMRLGESLDLAILDTALCNRLSYNLFQQLRLASPYCRDLYIGEEMQGISYSKSFQNNHFLLFPFCIDAFLDYVRNRICTHGHPQDTGMWQSLEL